MSSYSILPTDTAWTSLVTNIRANSLVKVNSITGYVNWDPLGSGHVSGAEGTQKLNDIDAYAYSPLKVSQYSDFPLSALSDWPVQDQVPLAVFLMFVPAGSGAPSFGTAGSYRPNRGPFYADQTTMALRAGTHAAYDLYGIFNDIDSGNTGPGFTLDIDVTDPSPGELLGLGIPQNQSDLENAGICPVTGLLVIGSRLRSVDGRSVADIVAPFVKAGPVRDDWI